jgi:hypothetical protein
MRHAPRPSTEPLLGRDVVVQSWMMALLVAVNRSAPSTLDLHRIWVTAPSARRSHARKKSNSTRNTARLNGEDAFRNAGAPAPAFRPGGAEVSCTNRHS